MFVNRYNNALENNVVDSDILSAGEIKKYFKFVALYFVHLLDL